MEQFRKTIKLFISDTSVSIKALAGHLQDCKTRSQKIDNLDTNSQAFRNKMSEKLTETL